MGIGELFEFERTGRIDPEPRITGWKSIAVWPEGACGCCRSSDEHPTREAAEAVCRLLRRHGFGGHGEVFPISTHVEPIIV
jgi:hypothetical protein